jgi:uncharacterized protein (DUF736 family)
VSVFLTVTQRYAWAFSGASACSWRLAASDIVSEFLAARRDPQLKQVWANTVLGEPTEPSENEKAPNLRVMAGNVEIGAAWQRTSKDNTVYHSVKLDDPSFSAPIYANLVAVDDSYALVWSR